MIVLLSCLLLTAVFWVVLIPSRGAKSPNWIVARIYIYEEWHKSHDNRLAVTHGLATTGQTITAAAAFTILVFGSFILGGQVIIEMFGIGLASAVLLDALIVRSILLPALMLILGKTNWALPWALERLLPHLNVEGAVDDAPAQRRDRMCGARKLRRLGQPSAAEPQQLGEHQRSATPERRRTRDNLPPIGIAAIRSYAGQRFEVSSVVDALAGYARASCERGRLPDAQLGRAEQDCRPGRYGSEHALAHTWSEHD